MQLSRILRAVGGQAGAAGDRAVTGISFDSRAVQPGHVFVAICGHAADGHRYIPAALERGAIAVVCERPVDAPVPTVCVRSSRRALAALAAAFYGDPARRVRAVGVTGTKGKTTTTYLIRAIVRAAGRECGVMGTIAEEAFGASRPSAQTTADPVSIQRFLHRLDRPDAGYCALEVSSHALTQDRVHALGFSACVFTNLSGDHLDYHETMEAYLEAKAALFDALDPDAWAVVHGSQPDCLARLRRTRARMLVFGIDEADRHGYDLWASAVELGASWTGFLLHLPGAAPREVRLGLVGRHNVENALAAAGAACALGLDAETICRGLASLRAVPGRLEPVEAGQRFQVLVDYAHTDAALTCALEAVRPLARDGQVRCVFGCGGDRDRTKRPRMARAAEAGADAVYVTSDNPRTEDPQSIIWDVVRGFREPGRVTVEPDRARAIARALLDAQPNDIVLIAGKGHETYQVLGAQRRAFDDRRVARDLLHRIHDRPSAPSTWRARPAGRARARPRLRPGPLPGAGA